MGGGAGPLFHLSGGLPSATLPNPLPYATPSHLYGQSEAFDFSDGPPPGSTPVLGGPTMDEIFSGKQADGADDSSDKQASKRRKKDA